MKKLLIIPTIILLIFCFTACGSVTDSDNNSSIAEEVKINLPADSTVNGYRNENTVGRGTGGMPDVIDSNEVSAEATEKTSADNNNSKDYCGNKNSKVFHSSDCSSVKNMKDENKFYADRETLISEGYSPCGRCNP